MIFNQITKPVIYEVSRDIPEDIENVIQERVAPGPSAHHDTHKTQKNTTETPRRRCLICCISLHLIYPKNQPGSQVTDGLEIQKTLLYPSKPLFFAGLPVILRVRLFSFLWSSFCDDLTLKFELHFFW